MMLSAVHAGTVVVADNATIYVYGRMVVGSRPDGTTPNAQLRLWLSERENRLNSILGEAQSETSN